MTPARACLGSPCAARPPAAAARGQRRHPTPDAVAGDRDLRGGRARWRARRRSRPRASRAASTARSTCRRRPATRPHLRGRAARAHPHRARRRAAWPRRSSTSPRRVGCGGEQGLLGPRLPSALRGERPLLRQLHRHAAATRTSRSSAPRPSADVADPAQRAAAALRGAALREPQRRRRWPSAPTACSTSASATAARAATRSATARTSARCSASCCASTSTAAAPTRSPPTTRSWRAPARARRSGPTACATRGASRSTARTGDLYIGDVGQNAREEIDVGVGPAPRRRELRLERHGGHPLLRPAPRLQPAGLTLPVLDYDHGDGCSVIGGSVYRGCRMPGYAGTYFYGDYCTAFVRSFRFAERRGHRPARLDGPARARRRPASRRSAWTPTARSTWWTWTARSTRWCRRAERPGSGLEFATLPEQVDRRVDEQLEQERRREARPPSARPRASSCPPRRRWTT